jgi:hypothetical protein
MLNNRKVLNFKRPFESMLTDSGNMEGRAEHHRGEWALDDWAGEYSFLGA